LEARVYRISLAPRAERDLRSLASEVQRRLKPRIDALARNPRPRIAEALKGEERFLRLRVGDYRIIYRVDERRLLVLVLKIGHRREVYRRP
jgi:mRNA interferase RelE/StbE